MTKLQSYAKEYAKFKAKEAMLDAEKAKLNEKIMAELKRSGQTSATFPEGVVGIIQQTEWIFTKAVEKKADELATLKEKEKETGKAKKVEKGEPTVRFTPSKAK